MENTQQPVETFPQNDTVNTISNGTRKLCTLSSIESYPPTYSLDYPKTKTKTKRERDTSMAKCSLQETTTQSRQGQHSKPLYNNSTHYLDHTRLSLFRENLNLSRPSEIPAYSSRHIACGTNNCCTSVLLLSSTFVFFFNLTYSRWTSSLPS